MTTKRLQNLPPQQRETLYSHIREIVRENDAVERSLAQHGEGLSAEDALTRIVECLAVRKARAS
jgi:hypothetical protein